MKFVSYGESYDPEIVTENIADAELTGEVRVVLDCGECGTELKEASLEYQADIEHDCPKVKDYTEEEGPQFEIESSEAVLTSRQETKDRHGKPIKNSRYWKTFYGAEITTEHKMPAMQRGD